MFKMMVYIYIVSFVVFIGILTAPSTEAATLVKGTFVNVTYDEIENIDGKSEKRLKQITIKNTQGKTNSFNIDSFTKLSINNISTTIENFKLGMPIEATVELRKVKSLSGKSASTPGAIEVGDKAFNGTINRIDKNGKFISIRLDDGKTKTYYLNDQTEFYKGTTIVDLSALYEGDRVKLKFDKYDSNFIHSLEINVQGVQIEHLYKGTIQKLEPTQSKLIVKNEKVFRDWKWESNIPVGITTHNYSTKTPIYVGNKKINKNQLRYYANNEVYYVTVKQFGKEIIQKIVIKQSNERTFYKPISSINITSKILGLQNIGRIAYHDGTILIRNGRLVDSHSLQSSGTAFVITEGFNKTEFANVIHATNDGFQSSNLTNHTIYFGQINTAGSYEVTLKNAKKLENNYWSSITTSNLTFADDSNVVRDFKSSILKVFAKDELDNYSGHYGYFYVANNHIVAAQIVGPNSYVAQNVSVGRLKSINTMNLDLIQVQNVSQWQNGYWREAGLISRMDIEQATIIRDGKVITAEDLQVNDRLFILNESVIKGRIILVD